MTASARGLKRYVELVADELRMPPAFCVDVDDYRATVYFALEERVPRYPDRDLALLWDEENGWAIGVESGCGEDIIVLAYLGGDIVPAPSLVARFVDDLMHERYPGQLEPPALRRAGTDDDLDERLAAFHRPN
ncbi:DUF6292 family protein [Qaidamihabitans albus]|uniref:DUF6292 family protein n=1 Tax=Qaidamihabitans albus TaxID=2795733 RepID=UPI001F2440C4|nr:DUF6292 family protein [Qaidamihabitans albus]